MPDFQRTAALAMLIFAAIPLSSAAVSGAAEPSPTAVAAFNAYVGTVESRLAEQHRTAHEFLAPAGSGAQSEARVHSGDVIGSLIIDRLTPSAGLDLPGAMLHHWRGTAFISGAGAADFERVMRNFNAYPHYFSPQVLQARVLTPQSDQPQAGPARFMMRVSQHHVITVVMDITSDITFGRLDAQHGYSLARSRQISEIASPGAPTEHALDSSEEHGYLWRQNTYWSYEERDGGLYIQIESVSLTRAVPAGLGWVIGPYLESIPRESLEFTLRSVCNALRR